MNPRKAAPAADFVIVFLVMMSPHFRNLGLRFEPWMAE